jgi:hypothetical protein
LSLTGPTVHDCLGDIWIVPVPPLPLAQPPDDVAALAGAGREAAICRRDRCSGDEATSPPLAGRARS